MEVDCYCEHYIRETSAGIEELFDSERKSEAIDRARESNRFTIYAGNTEVTVNMDLVAFMRVTDEKVEFAYLNGKKIVVTKEGIIAGDWGL